MRRRAIVALIVACGAQPMLAAPSAAAPFDSELLRAPPSSWVRPVDWTESDLPATSTGFFDRLFDYQVNIDTQEIYSHFVYLISSAGALSNGSYVHLTFDPAYQSVTLHAAKRWRNGAVLSQEEAVFQRIQREQSLEESMYLGAQTWLAFLKDVQVGDTVEIAYTVKGFNPIFMGRYCDSFGLQGATPVQRSTLRVVFGSSRSPRFRSLNTGTGGEVTTSGGASEYAISLADVPAIQYESSLPVGYQPAVRVDISEFASWAEVASWGGGLYMAPVEEAVIAKTRDLTADSPEAERKILAVLRYVQDDVRYLGIETGINSHKPRAPGEVLANRYGDCKDKVALFCSMAEADGFEAWPVLVHTWREDLLPGDIPSPLSFNHVIAALSWRGGILYLDPTRSLQGGGLEQTVISDFGWGLPLRAGTTALQKLPDPRASSISRTDLLRVADLSGPADLAVRYEYTASSADRTRAWLAARDPDSLRKFLIEELQDQYGEVAMTAEPVTRDDRDANRLSITVGFRVAKLLTTDGKRVQFEVYPSEISDRLRDPQTVSRRSQPMYFEHPITIVQDQVFELPFDWGLSPTNGRVDDPTFFVRSSVTSAGKRVTVHSEFKSLRDRVTSDDWSRFLADLKRSRQIISWRVSHEVPAAKAGGTSGPLAGEPTSTAVAALGAAIVSVAIFFISVLSMGADF